MLMSPSHETDSRKGGGFPFSNGCQRVTSHLVTIQRRWWYWTTCNFLSGEKVCALQPNVFRRGSVDLLSPILVRLFWATQRSGDSIADEVAVGPRTRSTFDLFHRPKSAATRWSIKDRRSMARLKVPAGSILTLLWNLGILRLTVRKSKGCRKYFKGLKFKSTVDYKIHLFYFSWIYLR